MTTFLISNSIMFAQSAFLEDGQSATAVSAAFASNKDAFSIGGTMAFSIKGRFDIRLTLGLASYSTIHYSGTVFSPTFELQIMKCSPQHPVGLSAGFSVETATYTDDYNLQAELSNADISLFGNIYHNFSLGKGVIVQPAYELHYLRGISQSHEVFSYRQYYYYFGYFGYIDHSSSQTAETNIESWLHIVGLTFSFKTSPSTQLVATPSIAMTSKLTTWGAELGIIF